METKTNYKAGKAVKKSLSLDEITESVASDFLNILGIEHSPLGLTSHGDPESPRERLLREFEKEAIASGSFIIEYEAEGKQEEFGCIAPAGSDCGDLPEDFDLHKAIQAAEEEHQRTSQLLTEEGRPNLSQQAKKLMPLEDITGKTLQQIAHDAAVPARQTSLCHESLSGAKMGSDYATLEYLTPLAMDNIEAMSIEGLKIQSSMSEEAPSSICSKSIENMLAFEGKSANLGLFICSEGAAESQALYPRASGNDVDRLLDLSVTLEEWLRLDAERSNNEEEDCEWIQEEDTCGNRLDEEKDEEEVSHGFKITEVHLSGLNSEPGKTHWGTKTQQQYGTRWLLASGMTKSSKHSFSKSSAIIASYPQLKRKVQNDDFLWSISSHANATPICRKELAGFVPHVRNPNVIFPK
ncbi:hypothetical protein GH714_037254 [Hevea brasiliensis]|uniref:PMI1/PMIR1-2 C-terminal domain-containing protein n=1 Tax=Hevea brasiliensis TaxID=3981 RepID=A0A6A6KFH6_HEVBR|nr:hypothetical protein GH714_037254 [Hevea brasiliensis]